MSDLAWIGFVEGSNGIRTFISGWDGMRSLKEGSREARWGVVCLQISLLAKSFFFSGRRSKYGMVHSNSASSYSHKGHSLAGAFVDLVVIRSLSLSHRCPVSAGSVPVNHQKAAWVANIIFVDSPVGTGFSYATNWEGVENSDTSQVAFLYEFLRKWLSSHPQFLDNPLYITGDSYSGMIIPILVEEVYNGKKNNSKNSNFMPRFHDDDEDDGYVIGNPLTYPEKDNSVKVPYVYHMGLISDELYESAKSDCHGDYMNVDPSNLACLYALHNISICTEKIYIAHILEPRCKTLSPRSNTSTSIFWDKRVMDDEDTAQVISSTNPNFLPEQWCRVYGYIYSYIWANDANVQRALHVREGTKEVWQRCNNSISYTENVQSSVPYHYNLTQKSLRALIYSGDHDLAVPYIGTIQWIKSLSLTVLGSWAPWFVDGQVAGYSTLYGNTEYDLTFTTIKGGGHTAPEYRPVQCFAMIDRWLAYYPL
ncbi:hypothetical protein SAY86_025506 [Trapa natans]|uniref:Serine carboxypeptidase-like 18 n=1 Tax=Trapa natans TaxID=22666 RepID=A0AAN7M8K7_TRANT|nr:hypothetical protein SAY86_025506 [Trapa natans]